MDRLFRKPNNTEPKPTQVEISELQTVKLDLAGLDEAGRLNKFEKLCLIFQHTNRFKTTSTEVKKLSGGMPEAQFKEIERARERGRGLLHSARLMLELEIGQRARVKKGIWLC